MEFNLSTFSLEIINFLILVWILQRLFYKPVRNMIAQRQQHIDQSLAEAAKISQQAEELKKSYGNRLQAWNLEKQTAITQLHQQMETEKQQQLSLLQQELEQERNKNQAALQRQQQELQRNLQTLALQNGARFAGLLLKQAAGPELENRLFDLLLSQLKQLPAACQSVLQTTENETTLTLKVCSVYPLSSSQVQQLEDKFNALIDKPLKFEYSLDATLIAGLKIDKDAWVLHANLQHELSGFVEFADDF